MEFLKNNHHFKFLYGGISFLELSCEITQTEGANGLTTVYTLADGLKVTNIASKNGDAYEWVNYFENTADKPTEILSELYDAYVTLPLPHEESPGWTAFHPEFGDVTTVYAPTGSTWSFDEFASFFEDPSIKKVGCFPLL